jgi:uncharacterized membrane protein
MSPLVLLHVVAGFSGLASGIIVMAMPNKGNKLHKKIGMVYFITMMVSTLLSIYLSIKINSTGLLSIGVFTFYMLVGGFLSTARRIKKFRYLFIPLSLIGFGAGVYMILTGIIFLIVFGGLQIWLVVQDIWMLRKKEIHPFDLQRSHAGKMAGSFIAASTAFAVNVIFTGGEWWHWLLPTFAITPLITFWNIQLKNKKKKLLSKG